MEQERNKEDMAFEAIANMFRQIQEAIEAQQTQPEERSGEILEKMDKVVSEVSKLKPAATFTQEQKEHLNTLLAALGKRVTDHCDSLASAQRFSLDKMLRDKFADQLTKIEVAINSLTNQKMTVRKEYAITHDFKNGRAPLAIAILGALFSLTLAGNYCQYQLNRQYRDNDLKYRYIKMKGGITAEGVSRMETFFGYNRDEDAIKQTRRDIEQYEQTVAEQAARIEQARLNEIQAEQLRQEAETLKAKK